jgi:hypothetical protein
MASPWAPKSLFKKLWEKEQVPSGLQSITSWPERPLIVPERSKKPEQKGALGMQVHAMAAQVNVEELRVEVVDVVIVWLQDVALQ